MESGTSVISEMQMPETYQKQTVGASARHVRTSQWPESEQDWTETDQVLYGKFLDSWKNKKSKTDLNGLFMKS